MMNSTKRFGLAAALAATAVLGACDATGSQLSSSTTSTTEDTTEGLAETSTPTTTSTTTTIDWWSPEEQRAWEARPDGTSGFIQLEVPEAAPARPVAQPDYVGGEGWYVDGKRIVQPDMCADAEDNCIARFVNGRWEAVPYDD